MARHSVRFAPARPGERLAIALDFPGHVHRGGAVLFGPDPLLGGDLDNNVLAALAATLADAGRPALRFDYRSSGRSLDVEPGRSRFDWWHDVAGRGDWTAVLEDAAEALARARRWFEPEVAIGYSFGAFVAHRARTGLRLAMIDPPIERLDLDGAEGLLVLSELDGFTPLPPPEALARRFPAARVVRLEEADHFHRGDEARVAQLVLDHLDEVPIR